MESLSVTPVTPVTNDKCHTCHAPRIRDICRDTGDPPLRGAACHACHAELSLEVQGFERDSVFDRFNGFTVLTNRLSQHLAAERTLRSLGLSRRPEDRTSPLALGELQPSADPAGDAKAALSRVSDMEALEGAARTLSDALDAKVSPESSAIAVALLFDTKTAQPANPEIYLNTLLRDLVEIGFPPAVVAGACQRLRRETVPVPEIAEVIAACAAIQGDYANARDRCARALADRQVAEHASRGTAAQSVGAPSRNVPTNPNAPPGDLDQ